MITKKDRLRVTKPVVLIAEELSPATLEALGPDFEVRNCDGANRAELLPALAAGVDAVLIRSATKMDAEAISAAKGLKVIARAGVGLDNVDIPAASAGRSSALLAPSQLRTSKSGPSASSVAGLNSSAIKTTGLVTRSRSFFVIIFICGLHP